MTPSKQTEKRADLKNSSLHHRLPSPPPEDCVLFPGGDDTVEKHPSMNCSLTHNVSKTRSAKTQMSTMPQNDENHVTDNPKAATGSRFKERKPYRRSTCLQHMSAVNCTAYCFEAKSLADPKMPPPAPMPPRLPTPELSDIDEGEFWSCCKSINDSESSVGSDCGEIHDEEEGLWDDMGKRSLPLRSRRLTD